MAGEGEVEAAVDEPAAVDEAEEQNRRPRIDGQNGARQVIDGAARGEWGARKDRAGRRTCSIIVAVNRRVQHDGSR